MGVQRIHVRDPYSLFRAEVVLDGVVFDADGAALVVPPPAPVALELGLDEEILYETGVYSASPGVVEVRLPPQHFAEPAVDRRLDEDDALAAGWDPSHTELKVPLLAGPGSVLRFVLPIGTRIDIPAGAGTLLPALMASGTFESARVDAVARAQFAVRPASFTPHAGGWRRPVWHAHMRCDSDRPAEVAAWRERQAALEPVVIDDRGDVDTLDRLGVESADIYGPGYRYEGEYVFRRLTLTPLGANADLADDRSPPAYEHRTRLGRDVFVRRVLTGHLSSGHRASVTVSSRRELAGSTFGRDRLGAYLIAEAELNVLESDVVMDAVRHEYKDAGREQPFQLLRLASGRFPIDLPAGAATGDLASPFLLRRSGAPVIVDALGYDAEGREVSLRMPLAFVPKGSLPAAIERALDGAPPVSIAASPVALAPPVAGKPGATAVTVVGMSFAVVAGRSSARPLLAVTEMRARLDALDGVVAQVPEVAARFDPDYLARGLDANAANAFLTLAQPQRLALPTAAVGGIGNPGGVVDAISARDGVIAKSLTTPGLSAAKLEEVVKASFPDAKLLGRISLRALIDPASLGVNAQGIPQVPALVRTGRPGAERLLYRFSAKLRGKTPGVSVEAGASLVLESTIDVSSGTPRASTSGVATGITLSLGSLVDVRFDAVHFATDAEGRTSFDVRGVDVTFGGALEFLAEIARKLESLGTGKGVRVDIDPQGVTAGFELAVPTLAMGVVQLSNLSIGAFLRIPFHDAPLSFSLQIARKERPFLATVSMFGGGGYLALELTPEGITSLEAAVEFGGSMALDIVVASGGVTVMAGIYFRKAGTSMQVSGYVRASGHLSVLGIVSIFVEFVMALTYDKRDGMAIFAGRASVTVGVRVLFFSESVTLSIEREFAGSAADPGFTDTFDREDWDEYCLAFARDVPTPVPSAWGGAGVR